MIKGSIVAADRPICENLRETSIHPPQLVACNSKIGGRGLKARLGVDLQLTQGVRGYLQC